jgi:hypothetical protein
MLDLMRPCVETQQFYWFHRAGNKLHARKQGCDSLSLVHRRMLYGCPVAIATQTRGGPKAICSRSFESQQQQLLKERLLWVTYTLDAQIQIISRSALAVSFSVSA